MPDTMQVAGVIPQKIHPLFSHFMGGPGPCEDLKYVFVVLWFTYSAGGVYMSHSFSHPA